MMLEGSDIPTEINIIQASCHEEGHSFIMLASDDKLMGIIELHATLRPEAKQVIKDLHQRNMSVYIISGDHEQPTKKLAQVLGIDHYFANTLPEEKAALVAKLQAEGKSVCFVGDGINDSIALKKANVSVSLSGATTMAMDTAQIVLMDGSLQQLDQLFNIAQDFEQNMKNNLRISVIPTAICIGGIIFFHWGVFIAHILMGSTLFAGIGNTMLPLLKSERTNISDKTIKK
jgi:Cu2+-exporting ATPase